MKVLILQTNTSRFLLSVKGKYFTLLEPIIKSGGFRALWLGNSLSTFGTSITGVVLPLIVYAFHQSTLLMSVVMVSYMLPNILMLPLSGLIVDRFNRIKLMMIADLTRAGGTGAACLLGIFGQLTIGHILVLAVILGIMEGLFQPAFSAMRAIIFENGFRTSANSLNQLSIQGMRLIGPSVAGVIVSVWSAPAGFGVDSLTYLISFICLLFLLKEGCIVSQNNKKHKPTFLQECFAGIHELSREKWLWVTIIASGAINVCLSGVSTILIPWMIKSYFHFPIYIYGIVMSSQGLGAAVAAFIFGMKKNWHHRGIIAYFGIISCGLAIFSVPYSHFPSILMFAIFIQGIGSMIFGLIWEISLQELVPSASFGRVASLDMLSSYGLMPIGYLLTGWASESIGSNLTLFVIGGLIVLIAAIVLTIPSIRRFD